MCNLVKNYSRCVKVKSDAKESVPFVQSEGWTKRLSSAAKTMQSQNLLHYKAVLTVMIASCVLWVVLLCCKLTTTEHNRDSLLILPFPDLFRLDGDLTVPVGACTWSQAAGLIPCVYRTGKQMQTTNGRRLHLAVVACGERSGEAMVLLKSAVALTTRSFLVFHIFTDVKQHTFFVEQLKAWPAAYVERVEFRIYPATYPDMESWKHQFAPCASQRLLIPLLLRDVDALVYVDADAVLLSPLDKLWAELSRFNSTHMVALAAEHEDAATSWYHHHSKIPFFRPYGLNSGVVLMNLTRLRQVNFTSAILQFEKEYGKSLSWFDQDLLNIFCHFHPDRYYKLSCSANYRGDHCTQKHRAPSSICKAAEHEGVYVLHGSKRAFHKLFPFIHVLNSFRKFKLESNVTTLLRTMENKLKKTSNQPCGYMSNAFLKHIRELAEKKQSSP